MGVTALNCLVFHAIPSITALLGLGGRRGGSKPWRVQGQIRGALHARAPEPAAAALVGGEKRAPLDLVTVIDFSNSMRGQKLFLVVQAVSYCRSSSTTSDRADRLGASFPSRMRDPRPACSGEARRVRVAAKVLDDRRQTNAVAARPPSTGRGRRSPKAGLCQPEWSTATVNRALCVDGEGF